MLGRPGFAGHCGDGVQRITRLGKLCFKLTAPSEQSTVVFAFILTHHHGPPSAHQASVTMVSSAAVILISS